MRPFKKRKRHDEQSAGLDIPKGPDSTGGMDPLADDKASQGGGRGRRKGRRNHDKGAMSSVLDEAVQSECIGIFRDRCQAFAIRRSARDANGNPTGDKKLTYVGWGLNIKDIGGLSKKDAKDRDKGALIESINTGRIAAMTTSILMDAGILLLIPTAETIEAADELPALFDAPYRTWFVTDDGKDVSPDGGVEVTLDDAKSVSIGETTIDELLAARGWHDAVASEPASAHADLPAPEEPPASQTMPAMDNLDAMFGDSDAGGASPQLDADATTYQPPAEPLPAADVPQPMGDAPTWQDSQQDEAPYQQPYDTPSQGTPDQFQDVPTVDDATPAPLAYGDDGQDIDAEQATDIARRIYDDDDLGITIDYDFFDQMFDQSPRVIEPFPEETGTGPLADYLRQMAIEANADLDYRHNANIEQLRAHFGAQAARYLHMIQSYYDIHTGDSQYRQMLEAIEQTRAEEIEGIDRRVRTESEVIKADYEKAREAAGHAAAADAMRQYDEIYQQGVNRRINGVRSDMAAEIEAHYAENRARTFDKRRSEARTRYDAGVYSLVMGMSDAWQKMVNAENERYEQHRRRIRDWISSNYNQEAAYTQTMAEYQRQVEEADKVRSQMQGRLDDQKRAAEEREDELTRRYEDAKRHGDEALASVQAQLDRAIAQNKEDRDADQRRIDDLMRQNSELRPTIEKEFDSRYADRIAQANSARDSALESVKHDRENMRSMRLIYIALFVIALIAMFCVGLIAGTTYGIGLVPGN